MDVGAEIVKGIWRRTRVTLKNIRRARREEKESTAKATTEEDKRGEATDPTAIDKGAEEVLTKVVWSAA